ncbi:LysR family transcriptional regulator ArgP [Undibacterium sp.]|jgi:LysR family transcriptional regulator (chromosome initiation inhibitor)|uniref:LysR family transcriptional regulator ArgP n=1 Tax=Undibacterium sp. TaxID=1914977 RepID=UPI002CE1F345|nr:LysR family transcriptional regulator ArgP [Undibacterium sp.]HTD02332.1 LysR family transcriptional regulator ArgP [Undibacterium sp.]
MKLDSRQCAALLAVIDSGSFEQAATLLRLTSSAVSQRVRALEIQLGSPLLVRSRPCRPTHAGQRLLQHLRRVQLLEQDLQADFSGEQAELLSIAIAVNADSLASWVLPAVAEFLRSEQVLLDVSVDDQDHTHALLEAGLALGCISTEAHAMRGCSAERLGVMRYRCMASPAFRQNWFADGMRRSSAQKAPVIVFNRKDKLQSDFLRLHYGILENSYPCHYVPASEPFMHAIALGMGWGMVPELMLQKLPGPLGPGALIDLAPDHPTDIDLYWHSWKVQSPRMQKLSQTLIRAAREILP